ncbi:MAG: VanZ family protein [Bacilli bacterium]|nr:VanZ family protein [Bacilli bacterium]
MKKTILWICIGLWIAFIFFNSLQSGVVSSATSGRVAQLIISFLEWLGMEPNPETVSLFVRKGAHVGEFFILASLLVFQEIPNAPTQFNRFVRIFIYTLTVAIADEVIQTAIPGRAGLIDDVGIDMIGATIAALGVWIIPKRGKLPQ